MTTTPDQAWAATLALLSIHQVEEIVFDMGEWQQRVGRSGWRALDDFVARSPLSVPDLRTRARFVAGQGAVAALLWWATRRSLRATRVVTTALCLAWGGAFVMHIALSVRTKSAMPGLSTSILPGLPGMLLVLGYIWR